MPKKISLDTCFCVIIIKQKPYHLLCRVVVHSPRLLSEKPLGFRFFSFRNSGGFFFKQNPRAERGLSYSLSETCYAFLVGTTFLTAAAVLATTPAFLSSPSRFARMCFSGSTNFL